MKQIELLHGEHLAPRLQYQALFAFLPQIPYSYQFGRPGIDPNVMLRACLYRCLRRLPTLSDLHHALGENPALSEALGLDPFAPPPSIERFSRWLEATPNQTLQAVRVTLVRNLLDRGAIHGRIVAFDSTPILAPVRENNLKTVVADRFNKHRYPQADPEARLSACRYYMASQTQKVRFFWGYRNHALVDFASELPLWEQTHPANYHESRCAIPLLEACAQQLHLPMAVVCGDSAYDSEKLLAYIIEQLHAQPVIAANARYQHDPQFRMQGNRVLCPAALPMLRKGRMTPKHTGLTYTQYVCPLHYNPKLRQRYLFCPANHPKFLTQKGCNFLLRLSPAYRAQIPYGSVQFQQLYKKRTAAERLFARLLSVLGAQPTVRGLAATRNHCTIAHIAALLVANAAHATGHPDKLAFIRTFVPNFMAKS